MIPQKVRFKNKSGLDLVGEYYPHDGNEAVILMHGFSENKDGPSGYYKELAKIISKKYAVLRFDFRACGESEGHIKQFSIFDYIKDFESALDFMKSKGYSEFYLIGHSLGGLISLKSAIKHPEIKKVITLAPAIIVKLPPRDLRRKFYKKYSLSYLHAFKIISRFLKDKLFVRPLTTLVKIKTPSIVLFSYSDQICNYNLIKPIIKNTKFVKWIEIKNANHFFYGKKAKQKIFKVIKKELKL